MKFPVFDLHCDTALALLDKNPMYIRSLASNELHIDLDRASAFPGYCQCFACFTTPLMEKWGMGSAEDIFEKELNAIQRELMRNQHRIEQVYSAAEIEENRKHGKMSAILTIEGPAGFGYDPALLEDLYNAGFRITTLGWNEQNVLTGSHKTGGGLTDLGREYVKEAQRLGMVIDVSHISDEGFWDIMNMTQAPVIASHSNSRAVHAVSRNLTDDMFRRICETGGVAGINQYADFVGNEPDIDSLCDHIFHFMELDPSGKHIALGGDLDGCDRLVAGISGIQDYPRLSDRLIERGLDETAVYNLFWNNALGVMQRCCI